MAAIGSANDPPPWAGAIGASHQANAIAAPAERKRNETFLPLYDMSMLLFMMRLPVIINRALLYIAGADKDQLS
jgi:hypothetical protein